MSKKKKKKIQPAMRNGHTVLIYVLSHWCYCDDRPGNIECSFKQSADITIKRATANWRSVRFGSFKLERWKSSDRGRKKGSLQSQYKLVLYAAAFTTHNEAIKKRPSTKSSVSHKRDTTLNNYTIQTIMINNVLSHALSHQKCFFPHFVSLPETPKKHIEMCAA